MITRLDRTALHCYSVITVVIGCIPFFKWAEMVVEGRQEKNESLDGMYGQAIMRKGKRIFWNLFAFDYNHILT